MPKLENNPIMKGMSGKLGDVVVYRRVRGEVVVSNTPKKRSGVLTPSQEATKSRFLRAVKYAKRQMEDPASKAYYQPGPNSKITSAYSAAVADYLKKPEVHEINTSRYGGAIGEEILVKASDNFQLTNVHVAIFAAGGNLLEQGEPTLQQDSSEDYVYKATVANAALPGTKILVTVKDRPGNITVKEVVIGA
jgi:signal peptidase I